MVSDSDVEHEFDETLVYYREYFAGKDRYGVASFFMGGDDTLGSYWVGPGESRHEQYLLYQARIRAIAQALSEHPLTAELADDIAVLRRLGSTEEADQKAKVKTLVDEFFARIDNPLY